MKVKILVYPKDENPYQELLYSSLGHEVQISYLEELTPSRIINSLILPLQLLIARLVGFKIYHLHWLYPFYLSSRSRFLMFISEVYLNILLETLRIFKFKIVWTAHNLLPHEKTFRDDIRVVLDLAKKVDIIIMLNSSVADDLIDLNHDLKDKIQVIPQGNYIKYYDFQHKLSNSDKTIYGFVGKIRPYKGLHDLIQIFKEIKCTNIKLQIVGKSNDEKYFQKLVNLSKGDSRITIENRYVQPSNLAKIVSGFDILVLPFTSITNSSTAMLAFSAKKPILAPRIGGMLDYPQNIGIFYDPINRDNLRIAIEKAADEQNNLQKLGENAFEYAKLNDWKNIAKKTVNLYLELAKS